MKKIGLVLIILVSLAIGGVAAVSGQDKQAIHGYKTGLVVNPRIICLQQEDIDVIKDKVIENVNILAYIVRYQISEGKCIFNTNPDIKATVVKVLDTFIDSDDEIVQTFSFRLSSKSTDLYYSLDAAQNADMFFKEAS